MTERGWSISDRFISVMGEIRQIDEDVGNDNPHQYPLRKMKTAAEKSIFDAITTASDIAKAAKELKREMKEIDERKTIS